MPIYACTHVTKEVAEDTYDQGAELERKCMMDESCNVIADTFAALIGQLQERYAITIDSLFIPDSGEPITCVTWNRLETADSDVPSASDTAAWMEGEKRLWLADWTFHIQARSIVPITIADVKESGVPYHE